MRERRWFLATLAIDALAAALASSIALAAGQGLPLHTFADSPLSVALFPPLWVVSLACAGAYDRSRLLTNAPNYSCFLAGACMAAGAVSFFGYIGAADVLHGRVLIIVPVATTLDVVARHIFHQHIRRLGAHGEYARRVVVIGYERAVANLCRRFSGHAQNGIVIVGACLPPQRPAGVLIEDVRVPVVGTFDTVLQAVVATGADAVTVLPCPEVDSEALRRLCWQLEAVNVDVLLAPALLDLAGPRTTIRAIDGVPIVHVDRPLFFGWRRVVKRVFDVSLATLLAVVALPLLVAIALAVKLGDGGPVLFAQPRVGESGRLFTMLKFRTMRVGAEDELADMLGLNECDGVLFKMCDDPRVTPVGRVLRRLSLDELPQIANVIAGTMSLVGPRPPLLREVELYEEAVHRRFAVKPGITGLWQVSGRSNLPWDEAVRLDLHYVEHWSIGLDLLILLRTTRAVIRRAGAY